MSSNPGSATQVGSLTSVEFGRRLSGGGLSIRVGPFDLRLQIPIERLHAPLFSLYRDHPLLDGERVFSCHAVLKDVWQLGRRPGRRIRFSVDGMIPHEDMPAEHGLPTLEWGLNLAIAMRFHCFLMLHAAVVERNGRALLLPAWPGHGKTTLCAALVHRGWRLLSDEFGLLRPGGIELTPVPRPMPLKNESIEVMKAFAPEAVLGPIIPNTRKGTVCHVKPPKTSVERAAETARAAWIVFPRWIAGASLALEPISKIEGFMQLATNAFNYELLGEHAFVAVRDTVASARCFRLAYSDLGTAVTALTQMADEDDVD